MCVRERLIEYIDYKNMSKRAFALRIGASGSFVNNISKGIGAEYIGRIKVQFPDLNVGWLLSGDGQMINDGSNPEENNTNQQTQSGMDMSFAMDYIAALKDQIAVLKGESATLKEQLKEKDALIRRLTEQGDDKSLSRRLGAVKEKQDKLDY